MRVGRSKCPAIPTKRAYPHAADGWSLSAASDCVDAASGVLEGGYFADVVVVDGDHYELCDVLAGFDALPCFPGVVETDFDCAAKTLVDNAGAVAEHEAPFDSSTGTHKQHPHMAFWYGYMNTCIPHTVTAHGNCQVVG